MKTLHTINTNFAKRFVMSLMLLMTIGVTAVLGDDNAFIDIYRSSNPLIYTTTPTVVETGKPVTYYFTGESQQSSDQGLDWQNGVSLTLEVPNDYSISKVIVVPYASSSIGDIVLVSDVVGSISRESQFVWTASDLVNQSIQEIVLKQSSSNGQKTRIKSISVTYQSSSMHTITWKVDGETYTEGNPSYAVAHGEKVNKLPTSPTSLPCDGKTFIGWAEENDYENYFYDVPSSPVIEESKTFHAVFASVAQAGGNSKTETLNGSDLVYSGNSGYVNFTAQTSSGMLWTGKANYNTSGYIQINKNSKNYHIGSPTFAGNVESIKIITTNNTVANRIFYICSSNSTAEPTEGDLGLYKTTATNQSFTIVLTNETKQFYIYSNGAAYISSVVVTYASNSYQDYTISCSSENTITLDPNGGESWTTNEINTWQGPDANGCYTKSVEKNTTVVLPTPTKIGNQFAGWIDDAANPVSSPYTPNSNVTLTAQWTPNQHTLTWKLEGGTVTTEGTHATLGATGSPTGNVAYGTTITAPVVEREGYTFQGWHDGTGIVTPASTMPDNNLTYTAQWQVNTYTLTWHLTGGTVTTAGTCADVNATGSPTGNVAYGTTITAPVVEREGYNFAGWNPNPTGTMPAENVEYTAQWTAKRLTNFRTLCCKPLEAPTGLTATPSIKGGAVYWSPVTGATSYEVTYDGGNKWHTTNTNSYVIDGIECGHVNVTWQVRAIGDGTTYCDEGPASDEHNFQTSECACPGTYSFHYSNESVWNDDEIICFAPVTGDENNYLTENISLPYAQQYKVAWESKDQIKDVNADWSSVPTEFASNMPFYHNRDKKFGANPQNGNLGGGKGRFHVYHDSKSDNKFISFIPTGYTLNFGSGDEWTNYQTLNFLPKTSNWNETEWYTELITLTNDHLSKQLFVGLETENGYVWCDPYSEKTNLTGLRTKTGADDNWVTGGMSTSYANKTGKFRIYADSGDKNWYVTFVPHYQLHYNANGGSGSMASLPADAVSCEESDADRTVTIDACTFTAPAGHYFTGWNTNADGNGTPYSAGENHTLTGDITLYAQWSNLYTLEWDFQEGTPSHNNYTHAGEVAYGTTLTAPTLTREGWTFIGWDPVVPATMPAQDVTYVAQWQVNTYTVTWNANGGKFGNETSVEQSYSYGAKITAPADPTRTSYTFAGWDPAPAATMPASNLTYNAQWNCTSPTDIKINGAYIVFPGETIELTVTGNNIADDATYQWHKKNGENYDELVGQTTATLTIPNCVVGDAANYKCVVTNGACSAENDFTVKMYRLRGLTDPENSWTTDFVFAKGENKTATYSTTLNGNSSYQFKVHDGSVYYGNTGANPTMTSDNCTGWTMQESMGNNVTLQTTITGTYIFTLDYTDESNPTISVTYPQKKMVYLNPGPWDVAGAKFAVHTWIGENGADLFMEKVDDCTDRNIYQAEIDASHANIIFVRVNPAISNINQLWENEWNRTSDLTLPTDENVLYDMTSLYLTPNLWNSNGAWFAAYFYNASGNTWRKMTDSDGDGIYECEKVSGYPNVIFCRMNPSNTDLAWGSKWNQTGNLTIPTQVNNHFIVPIGDNAWNQPGDDGNWHNTGMWTTFTPYHTISYNMNGHGTQIEDNCIEDGDTWSAPNDPTAVGYTFLGWRRPAATGDSKLYKNGQTGYTPTASETLTAQWQINQCVVTWKVNAAEVAKTTVDITNPLTSIPYTPTDDELGCCAEKFIGWSTETNPTKNQVYTTASELQNLIGTLAANTTKTFHAVFATPVPGAGNSLVTFNEMGYANEEAVASVTLGDGMGNGDATITFNKGTAATYAPSYYNIGEAVRTYAGNTITVAATYANTVLTQIDFAFAKGENANAITASTGTITDGVWTGNAQSVTFTIGGTTGHRRIASIAVTTEVTGDKYTNYITKCDLSKSAFIGAGTITYANSATAIDTKCGQRSPASKAATLTFASAQNLTCPITIEATTGFLVSTNRNDNSKYASSIIVKPVKTGTNKGKLPTIYVRYEANFGATGQIHGTISATGSEIEDTGVAVLANVTCTQYTLTVVDHLGNTISTTQYYEGDEVAEVDAPATDDCSKDYTFDGWSETSVEYGSLIYNKVSFPFTMPANDVTLYPVYVCSKDYHRVTEDLGIDNWEGQYLIAHSNTEFANGYQGGTTDGNCIGGTNSVRDLSQYITNDVVSKDCDIRSVKLIAVNGGYVLQTRDGKYNYITAGAQSGLTANDNLSTADDHPLTIIFNSETDIAITNLANVNQASLQYSATYFRFYKPGNQNPVYLYKKYLYTTPLICGTIEAEDAVVTSTAGQTIKVNVPITITSTLGGTTNITAESDNDHFAVTPLENVATGEHTIAVHYTPDAITDGTESANITLTASHGNRATTTFQMTGRHLPENFVIAAKWGENWYVLPADMTSESITEGLLIEVDDPSDPTKALAAPNTTKYGLKSVYTTSGALDRYKAQGENIVFVENITGNNKTLYNAGGDAQNSTNTNIQVYAQYKTATSGYYETNPERYEWTPTTTDLKDYTLTSAHTFATEAARTVSLDNHGIFGTLLQDKSYNGMVRLLPVDNFYEPIELQVVEWKEDGVNIMYTGAGTKYTTQVGNNAESSVLAAIDHAVYSLSTKDLTSATNQPLIITIKDDADAIIGAVKLTIPAIVATDKRSTALGVTEENAKATSIVILDGATLTAGTTKYTYNDVVVYPGGNLVIDTDGKLGMYTLTLRAGSSWGAAEYEHKYPQFLLKGDYSNSSGQINLDYVTTQDYYYPLSVPEEVTIRDIKYPVDIYGSNVDKDNTGSFRLKYYDGEQRVDQGSQYGTGWVVVNENTTTTLTPNQGYAIWGIPKKVSVNGATSVRQKYGIHRIPIKKAAGDLATNEKTNAEIPIKAHGINDANVLPNDKGWNYLGNPYLAQLGGMDGTDDDLQMGLLVQEVVNGQWTGGWVNNGAQVRYVTLTNDCQTFEAKPVAEAQIPAFTTFFIQAAQEDGAIALTAPANAVPASVAARRYAAQQETAKEITTGILLTGNDQTDRTGLLIADNFTEEYDYNADLSKFENSGINLYTIGKTGNLAYMAINQALAEQPIPVGYTAPAEGLYTIAFDEDRYNATDISALYLIDYDSNEKTNLLHTDYSFVTAAGTNNQRFALQVAFAPENATNIEWVGDATIQVGVEGNTLMLNNLPTDAAVHVFDALGRLMYHAPTVPTEMQLTLPTGYYLVRIADKQNAVVIKTVIP